MGQVGDELEVLTLWLVAGTGTWAGTCTGTGTGTGSPCEVLTLGAWTGTEVLESSDDRDIETDSTDEPAPTSKASHDPTGQVGRWSVAAVCANFPAHPPVSW